jgi:hypothetical protein
MTALSVLLHIPVGLHSSYRIPVGLPILLSTH